ncbi:hypothetical protein Tco_0403254 [Tanacetum coccineum]
MDECHRLLTDQVDLVNPEGHRLVPNLSKPLPLRGPPGDTARSTALSISKLKAAHYPDFGLKELVHSLWIESERDYNISTTYGITHWWFKRKEFYITKYSASYDRRAVRSYIRILSVISLKTFERYGRAFLREIVIRRADYKEYKISEADFKNLHPNNFEHLYLLHLQGKLTYLDSTKLYHCQQAKVHNLFKVDYTISDGTLTRIRDKLDYMVKDYKLYEFNPGMESRVWSEDDKKRSEAFIEVIERRLNIRRIFINLESFVSRRLRDVDYRLINKTE